MKNKKEIVENWLPRYTGIELSEMSAIACTSLKLQLRLLSVFGEVSVMRYSIWDPSSLFIQFKKIK